MHYFARVVRLGWLRPSAVKNVKVIYRVRRTDDGIVRLGGEMESVMRTYVPTSSSLGEFPVPKFVAEGTVAKVGF